MSANASTSELHDTIETMILFHDWRNGGSSSRPDLEKVTAAIDHSISVLMQVENLIQQRGRHNTEIAFMGLANATRTVVPPVADLFQSSNKQSTGEK
ncbi:hypothetical protein ACIPF8_19055 [Collimonas sp. NPDC087041]|uniref:hypothetical protein n=1 Tax=Collimonas sp. NPDC087041 TaxID=3363960 RepID=UPI00381FAF52